jgi:hypothetical protein
MKKLMLITALSFASTAALADSASQCGWGSLLFNGQTGKASNVVAMTTNGIFANNTFGVTFGTNGCEAGTISYGGKSMVQVGAVMDEFSEDVARGDGEVLTAVAVTLGVSQEDRPYFKQTMQQNFAVIFPDQDVTQEDVLANMWQVIGQDDRLAKYI